MKPLRAMPLVSHLSPETLGGGGLRADQYSALGLRAKAILGDGASSSDPVAPLPVAQPWHGCENSAPDDRRRGNPSHRIAKARLVSLQPDRRLTGERAAEGWATGLNTLSSAAVASGDAKFSPRVRIQQSEPCRASPWREAEERNLLP